MMYQEYASQIAENGELGLAKQLYESMKQNTISPVRDKVMDVSEKAGTYQNKQVSEKE